MASDLGGLNVWQQASVGLGLANTAFQGISGTATIGATAEELQKQTASIGNSIMAAQAAAAGAAVPPPAPVGVPQSSSLNPAQPDAWKEIPLWVWLIGAYLLLR